MIVVFHDDAPFGTFPPGRVEARARANPAAWAYLDRAVLGTVQTIEAQYGFRADHVYSSAIRGFAARLTEPQVQALRRHPFVASIEEDGTMMPFEQVLPWGIDRIDADLSSARSADGFGEVTNVNLYVLDTGVESTHPDLNVVNHVTSRRPSMRRPAPTARACRVCWRRETTTSVLWACCPALP